MVKIHSDICVVCMAEYFCCESTTIKYHGFRDPNSIRKERIFFCSDRAGEGLSCLVYNLLCPYLLEHQMVGGVW
jgi:hypothetical protein